MERRFNIFLLISSAIHLLALGMFSAGTRTCSGLDYAEVNLVVVKNAAGKTSAENVRLQRTVPVIPDTAAKTLQPYKLPVRNTEEIVSDRPSAVASNIPENISGNTTGTAVMTSEFSGKSGSDSGKSEYLQWLGEIRQQIDRNKRYPRQAREQEIEGKTELSFTVNQNGEAENVKIIRSSGCSVLDEEAKRTVLRAQPFRVIPSLNSSGFTIRVAINFNLK